MSDFGTCEHDVVGDCFRCLYEHWRRLASKFERELDDARAKIDEAVRAALRDAAEVVRCTPSEWFAGSDVHGCRPSPDVEGTLKEAACRVLDLCPCWPWIQYWKENSTE